MSSSVHIDNNGKDILILGKGPTGGLGESSLTAEKIYSINFSATGRKFYLSLHYNRANSYLFVNGTWFKYIVFRKYFKRFFSMELFMSLVLIMVIFQLIIY